MEKVTLGKMFLERAQTLGSKVAVQFKAGKGAYQSMAWQDFRALTRKLAFGLAACGLQPKTAIGILSPTSHLWVAADVGIILNGAFSVPLYPNSSVEDVEHILNNSEASFIFVCGEPLLSKVLKIKSAILKKVIYITPLTGGLAVDEIRSKHGLTSDYLLSWDELQEIGKRFSREQPNLIDERVDHTKLEDILTIIYTSGTTGTPKGVPITHNNVVSLLTTLPPILPLYESDVYLSYLPLSHVFERVCGEFYWLYYGGTNAFAESIETMAKNLAEIQPSYLLAVPRVLDRVYAKVKSGIDGASGRARTLIEWSIAVGAEIIRLQAEDKPVRPALKLKHWLAEKLVFRKLRERIGKNLRFIICGGAPATPAVLEFFNAIGIPTLEGYGLTETTAPTNCNRPNKIKLATVGPVMDTVEMKIAEDGEILVRGASIFNGYFKDERATAEVFSDGWFKTGDIGHIDKDGYLKITDRKKDIIVNSAGKNVAPQRVENLLRMIPQISQIIVFGDKRKHLVGLITLDENETIELAREKGWQFETFDQVCESQELYQYLKTEIDWHGSKLAEHELVRNFLILKEDLSIDSGELTATLKVKRSVVAKKYQGVINSLYRDELVTGS